MESHLDAPAGFMDDLLDFASDIGEEDDKNNYDKAGAAKTLAFPSPLLLPAPAADNPGAVEEELEWITNKDAFPMVESFVDIIPNHNNPSKTANHQSPVSVLDNNSTAIPANLSFLCNLKVPVRPRSKSRKRRSGLQWQCWLKQTQKTVRKASGIIIGRKCQHCQSEKTPQWRAGPMGPKTLCNACGVRYKSGRLVPEYRPASSPTFVSELHSNSHRKITEMRRIVQGVGVSRTEIGQS